MANVDNLNFKVIIDDKQFNQKIKAMEDMAKKFNTSMSNLLNVQAVSQQLVVSNRKRLQMETDLVRATEMQNREKIKTEGLQRKINAQIERTSKGYQSQSRILQELKGYALGYLSIHGASQLLSSLVRVTGEFELQKTTLAAMLGDLNQAEQVITRIQGLAVESPFQFKELTTYAKQLSAFSVPAQELYDTTKMLADISAGLGVGMDRIVLAYGQVRSAAFLRGQEVRQFTEAGIPILDELAKQFSELEGRAVSTGEVFDKISARLVPFEMVAKVFKDMTSEGGKFYNMQEVQAETLRGKISNLKDAYEVMLNEIGSGQSEKLKGAVDWAKRLMQNYKEIGGQIIDLIKLFGSYKVAVGLLSISDTIAKYGGLAKAIQQTTIAQKVLNSALLTNPYIAVATAISAVVIALHRKANSLTIAERAQSAYNQRMRDASREESRRRSEILGLVDVVNDETQATIEREAALLSLKESYPKIFEQYDIESLKLSDILRIKRQIAEEDAKTRRTSALGSIAAQQSRYSSLVNRGAGQSYKDEAFAILQEMEKGYLSDYIIPELTAGLKDIGDEDLQKLKDEIYRKAQYDIRGLEKFDGIPTTQDFYEEYMKVIRSELSRRKNVKLTGGWRKTVQDTLKSMGLNKGTSFGLWAEDTTQSTEYVDDMIKRYKELGEQIKNVSSFDPDQTERLKKNKEAIEAIAKALNIDIKNLSANDSDTWESKEEKRLKRLIETLRKLQDQYDELKSLGVSDDAIKSLFKGWFPELGGNFFNNMDFLSRAKTAVEELRKYNPGAADQALVNLGGDKHTQYVDKLKEQQKAYKESAKAAGEYFNILRKWAAEDFNISGEGIAFDLSKITSEFNEKINEIELKTTKVREIFNQIDLNSEDGIAKVKEIFVKEFGADAWSQFWTSYKQKGFKAIRDLAEAQKEAEKTIAQEKARDIGKKYAKELLKDGGVSLSDLSDKTYRQLSDMADKIELQIKHTITELGKIDSEEYDLTEDEKSKILALEEALKELGVEFDKVVDEKTEKFLQNFSEVSTLISGVASELSELGESLGSGVLSELGTQLGSVISGFQSVLNGFIQGGVFGGAVALLSYGVGSLLNAIKNSINHQDVLNEKAREYADKMSEARRKAYEGLSGTNSLGEFEYNTAKLKEAEARLSEAIQSIKDTGNNFFGPNVMHELQLASIEGGWNLYKENGELNIDAIEVYYDTFAKRLSRKEKRLVEQLIEASHDVTEASLEQAQYLRDIYNEVADSIADAFVDAYRKSGEAALDYGEIMDGIATKLVKDIIKKTLLEQIFTDKNILDIASDIESQNIASATQKTEALLKQAENLAPVFEKLFGAVDKYIIREEDTATIGSAIKGVTEDTANLLASYLNAIRADVSFGKTQWSQMNVSLQQIVSLLTAQSTPSLSEYQAQIAANTLNTAVATQAILSRLESVITSEGGFDAIRTYS